MYSGLPLHRHSSCRPSRLQKRIASRNKTRCATSSGFSLPKCADGQEHFLRHYRKVTFKPLPPKKVQLLDTESRDAALNRSLTSTSTESTKLKEHRKPQEMCFKPSLTHNSTATNVLMTWTYRPHISRNLSEKSFPSDTNNEYQSNTLFGRFLYFALVTVLGRNTPLPTSESTNGICLNSVPEKLMKWLNYDVYYCHTVSTLYEISESKDCRALVESTHSIIFTFLVACCEISCYITQKSYFRLCVYTPVTKNSGGWSKQIKSTFRINSLCLLKGRPTLLYNEQTKSVALRGLSWHASEIRQ